MDDDSNAPGADANVELHAELLRVIHDAMMRGLPEADARTLAYGCGIDMKDVQAYQHHKGARQ